MRISLLATVVATVALVTSCGTTQTETTGDRPGQHHAAAERPRVQPAKGMPSGSGMRMAGMQMRADGAAPGPGRPSSAAAMICAGETGRAIQRTLSLRAVPSRHPMWMPPVYGCVWRLPASVLEMAVDDAKNPAEGRRRFAHLRASTPRARRIAGMASFGLPAFDSADGTVVFLKDGKVLSVDARKVAHRDLPKGFSREGVAYAVASAVIGCWSE